MRPFLTFVALAACVFLATPGHGEQRSSPEPDISLGTCIEHGGTVEQPEGSPIRACCLDGIVARGCYICDNAWRNCVWEPAFSNSQGGGTKGVVDQGVLANPQVFEMQPQLHGVTGTQPQTLGTEDKAPKTKKKLQVVKPLTTLLQPVPLDCSYSPASGGASSVRVRNSTDAVIAVGRQIGWRTAAGDQGALALPRELYPGKEMRIGASQTAAPGCSAWLVPQQPQLLQ